MVDELKEWGKASQLAIQRFGSDDAYQLGFVIAAEGLWCGCPYPESERFARVFARGLRDGSQPDPEKREGVVCSEKQ